MTAVTDRGAMVLLGLLVLLPRGMAAQPSQPDIPVEIRERVLTEVGSRWSTSPQALAVDWTSVAPAGPVQAADEVQLRGDGANGWFLLVIDPAGRQPFSIRVRAGRVTTLPVATRYLRRDDVLEPEDIAHVTDTLWGPPPVEGELIAEPGWRVRRNVRMGAPLIPPVVMPPPIIELGHRVVQPQDLR